MRLADILAPLTRRIEIVTLLGVMVVGGALWAFIGLAAEMMEGDLHAFDEYVLLSLRTPGDLSDPIGGPNVEVIMRDITALGGVLTLTLLSVTVGLYLVLKRQAWSAVLLWVAVLGGQGLSHLAKSVFSRPRPDLVPHDTFVSDPSFPSGHSMMAAVVYLTLAVMLARQETRWSVRMFFIAVAATLAMSVGVSRIYLGVHWPSDVLAGWSLGAAWAFMVWLVARWLERRGSIEPERHLED